MKYHNNGEAYPLSCGCVMVPREHRYDHFIHPKCTLDAGKQTIVPGYEYRPWRELPKIYQERYKKNIFSGGKDVRSM